MKPPFSVVGESGLGLARCFSLFLVVWSNILAQQFLVVTIVWHEKQILYCLNRFLLPFFVEPVKSS